MPTLPLFDSPSDPHAWHRVRSPGGYEFWRIQARAPDNNLHVEVIFSLGGFWRDDYVKQTARYLRRPTRTSPPIPGDYPAVQACIRADGQETTSRMTLDASDFQASTQPTTIRFAANSLQWNSNGACRIEVRDDQMQIALDVEPRTGVAHEPILPSEHHRLASATTCQVTGSLRCTGRDLPFAGSGIIEHRYGTRPIERTDYSNNSR